MNNSILNLIKTASERVSDERLRRFAELNDYKVGDGEGEFSKQELADALDKAQEYIFAQFTGKTFEGDEVRDLAPINIKEALTTSDVSIVFPRVISEILREPTEPNLFLTNTLSETIRLADNNPLFIEFPTVDALQAFEIAEGAEYSNQVASFGQHQISMRIKKFGVATAITEETIKQSMWNLLQMHMRMMSAAINRTIESRLYQCMVTHAQTVFDNESAVAEYKTTGKSISGSALIANGSFSFNDLVKMTGVMLGNRYQPSHFLAHPLAWSIFAQDPIMKAQFYHAGQLGQGIWSRMPSFDQQANFPYGITYVPYYALPYNESDTLTDSMSALGASLTSNMYLVDARNALFLATKGDIEMDQMENWFRDATMVKARKYAGVSAKAGGRGMLAAKNIRIVENQEPILTMRTVSA